MSKYTDRINSLADRFFLKIAQSKPSANVEYYLQTSLANLINTNYASIINIDGVVIEVFKYSSGDSNSIVLHFMLGNKEINRSSSDTAANIETDFIKMMRANDSINAIFDSKQFSPFKVVVDKKLLKLTSKPGRVVRDKI